MIRVANPFVSSKASPVLQDVLDSVWLSPGGKYDLLFRNAISSMYEHSEVVLTNSGTSAIEVALQAVGRVYGKTSGSVIVPAYTCPDTLMAVLKAGYQPVICDVDKIRCCLTKETLLDAMGPSVVGVVPVHLYGMMVDLSVYVAARNLGLFIVDDACEAFGGKLSEDLRVTDVSDAACFSFRGEKLLPVGTGGAIVTRHPAVFGVSQALVGLNSSNGVQRYWCVDKCLSYEYPELLAALGYAQIAEYPQELAKRWAVVDKYVQLGVTSPFLPGDVPWKYPVLVKDVLRAFNAFYREGIEIGPPFVPLHHLPGPENVQTVRGHSVVSQRDLNLPGSDFLWQHCILLPLHSALSDQDVVKIVSTWKELSGL